jgi:hypothetical protein
VIKVRHAVDSPLGVVAVICALLTLLTPWVIRIPHAGLEGSFGFQVPVAWLIVVAFVAALLVTNLTVSLIALLAGEALLLGWFGWAAWVTTTSRFASFDFPFMGIDLIGPAWFFGAVGLMAAGVVVARKFAAHEARPGAEVWLLALLPGLGLIRLDRPTRGTVYVVLVLSALFLASIDSPVAPLFQPLTGDFEAPPPPPTRLLEWIFFGTAAALALLSVIETARFRRRLRDDNNSGFRN